MAKHSLSAMWPWANYLNENCYLDAYYFKKISGCHDWLLDKSPGVIWADTGFTTYMRLKNGDKWMKSRLLCLNLVAWDITKLDKVQIFSI